MHDEREFEMPRVRRRTSLTVAVEDPRGWDGDGAASSVKSVMKLTRRPSLFVVKSSPRVPQRSLFTRWAWLLEPSPPHTTHTRPWSTRHVFAWLAGVMERYGRRLHDTKAGIRRDGREWRVVRLRCCVERRVGAFPFPSQTWLGREVTRQAIAAA